MFPEFRKLDGRLLFAANAEYAGPEFVLHGGDDLALITPVSGGSDSGAG
jgi:molybdopterin converting factor small subunit